MVSRGVELKANLGQCQAEWLLKNQQLIPTELRGKTLVFPGTIWQDFDGYRHVACLGFVGERWVLLFLWLGRSFLGDCRLVRFSEQRLAA